MSSSTIKALIHTCEAEISSLEMEIKQKKQLIEDQENCLTAYKQQSGSYSGAFVNDKTSYDSVLDMTDEVLVASHIEAKFDDDAAKISVKMQNIEDISFTLRSALLESCDELDELVKALQAKRDQLSSLWSQYESARRHERARAAAAAAAAQQ